MTGLRAPVRGHLDQVDLFRVLTFCAVVAVHATAFGNAGDSVGAGAAGILLHFTREAFFFLTAFVLVYSQGDRPLRPVSFWMRRFRLVGVPYLTWTVIYLAYTQAYSGGPASHLPRTLAMDIISGNGFYHLYFLVVSMQVYLLFPVLMWLLHATRRHPWLLLAAVVSIDFGLNLWGYRGTVPASGPLHFFGDWSYVLFPSYLLYIVAGALAAQHLDRVQAAVLDHSALVLVSGLLSAGAAEAWFALEVHRGVSPDAGAHDASAVFQPVMVLWSLGAIALLGLLGCHWAARRSVTAGDHPHPGRFHAGVMWASSASFGVYLIHPLILDQIFRSGVLTGVAQPVATVLIWALTLTISAVIVGVFRRTPLSMPLTGRARPTRARGPVNDPWDGPYGDDVASPARVPVGTAA